MERNYWLLRKRKHMAHARDASCSEAKLIHLDLAGRYSIKAAAVAGSAQATPVQPHSPVTAKPVSGQGHPAGTCYEQLEIGARWLASRAACADERAEHLGMANKYARLRLEFRPIERT
jgi:hypothetical protein